jgi:phosphohistidine phosphatase SixA
MGTIYLIRHAQASFGAADHDRLSEVGLTQAGRSARAGACEPAPRTDRIVSGTMRRHEETARGCLEAMGAPAEWESDSDRNVAREVSEFNNHRWVKTPSSLAS